MADEMIMKEILYYIYEMEMPEECRKIIQEAAEKAHMTTDQLFCGWLKYLVENPEETKKVKADWDALSVEERAKYEQIKLVRIYPVHEGESDEAARAIAVYKERYGKQIPLPEISQTDFIEHLDDDNFFLAYGNPVVVKALIEVIIDDTEYEISCIMDYLKDLKPVIKRLEEVEKYDKKRLSSNSEKKINYYLEGMNYLLTGQETVDNYLEILNSYRDIVKSKNEHIKKLFDEIKTIKKLKI